MILGKEPAIILGAVAAALAAAFGVDYSDGFQAAEAVTIASPIAAAFSIRLAVFSQSTVDELAPRDKQIQVVQSRRRRRRAG